MELSDIKAKIAVVGLGNAGLPLAAVIADRGIAVWGVDINEERCRLINQGTNPIPGRGFGGADNSARREELHCHTTLRRCERLLKLHSDCAPIRRPEQ